LLTYESAFLILIIVTGALGGMGAYFWQQSSRESMRINGLLYQTQQIRSELYRQLKEVTRGRLMEDQAALDLYQAYSRRIGEHFNALRRQTEYPDEEWAVQAMQQAYRVIQRDMNRLFSDPYLVSDAVRLRILDSQYEESLVGDFEQAFDAFSDLIATKHRTLEDNLARWTRFAPVLIPVAVALAVALLVLSRFSLQHGFVRPMRQVVAGAERLSQGELQHTVPENGVKEVSDLARAINRMARDLAASRDALVESERQAALGALVPVVAHNIRNPLASIRATAQVLDHLDEPEDLHEAKQAIMDTVDRLERWVSSLLSYLHPLKPHRQLARLERAMEGALAALQPRVKEKQLEVVRGSWEDKRDLRIDIDLMEQAIYSLLVNAVDASPYGGRITLSVQSGDGCMNVLIEDQGPGIPFDPRPDTLAPGPSTKRYGTGLGIPFAFKVCHAHGGKMTFTRTAGGTQVCLRIPLNEVGDLS
jgi:Signal transduction histidine kinase